jgi:hypothetical protein
MMQYFGMSNQLGSHVKDAVLWHVKSTWFACQINLVRMSNQLV